MVNSNFSFLAVPFPVLEKTGRLAENYLYADPNACIYKMGTFAETIVNEMFRMDGLKLPSGNDNTQANKVKILKGKGLIPMEISDIFDRIRISRNEAVHANFDSFEECRTLLEQTHTLSIWFIQTYGDEQYKPVPFVLPDEIPDTRDLMARIQSLSADLAKAEKAALSKMVLVHVHADERKRRAEKAARNIRLSGREARYIIDEQLRKVGWEADTFNLRYSKGTRPEKDRNIAIAEWPTDLTVCKWGYMDYALFSGLELVGVVDADADRNDMLFSINNQCREYSMGVKEEHMAYVIGMWGEYKVPFLFATNGRSYMKQIEKRSGVWFRDARGEANMPRILQGWIGPRDLRDMLELDISAANRRLSELTYDLLRDKNGLGLRPYQIEAIEKTEDAILKGEQTALLEMAAGTGKTRIVPGMIHRFLKTGRFRRILLLVDQTAPGGLTPDVFRVTMIENHMTLEQIYDTIILSDKGMDRSIKIHVSTVHDLYERIFIDGGESMPTVTDYDLIIADDADKGYALDRETGGADQINEYRAVLEYFDAVKILLTSNSTRHAADLLPVFTYRKEAGLWE